MKFRIRTVDACVDNPSKYYPHDRLRKTIQSHETTAVLNF